MGSHRLPVIVLLALLYGCGALTLNLTPLLIGSYIEHLNLSKTQAGLLATTEIISMGLTSTFIAHQLQRLSLRATLIVALLLAFVSNALSSQVDSLFLILPLRALAGMGNGLTMAVVLYLVAQSANQVRLLGFTLTGSLLTGSFFLALLPTLTLKWQLTGFFLGQASFPLLLALLMLSSMGHLFIQETFQGTSNKSSDSNQLSKLNKLAYLFITAVLLIHIAQGGYFSFLEVIGSDLGIGKTTIGFTLSASFLLALLGSLAASTFGERHGTLPPLLLGLIVQSTAVYNVVFASSETIYILAVTAQSFSYFFFTPYLLATASMIDESGRLSALGMGIILMGIGTAPLLFGFLIQQFNTNIIAWCMISSGLFALSSLIFIHKNLKTS